ncbi:hypothetical protein ABW20_dc0109903 [Dactylellina cionopaga]|nr:hypothetical protein ABW20_dc0109903 [Dactylellina cionopaga]
MTLLALSNEILLQVFGYLCNNDLAIVKRVCSRFNNLEVLATKRTYVFRVDASSWSTWKFARHLLTNPETGKRFTMVDVEWHCRDGETPRPKYWVWTDDEAEKIVEICKKHGLSETVKAVVLGGVNSEALLPFVFCFMPHLESLDMGKANPDPAGFAVECSAPIGSFEILRNCIRLEEAKEIFGSYDRHCDLVIEHYFGDEDDDEDGEEEDGEDGEEEEDGEEGEEEEDGKDGEEDEDGEDGEEEGDAEAWLKRRTRIYNSYASRETPEYTSTDHDDWQELYEPIREDYFCPFDQNCGGGPTPWPVGLANLRNLTHVQIITHLDRMDYKLYISRILFLPKIQSIKFEVQWGFQNELDWMDIDTEDDDQNFDFENSENLKSTVKVLVLKNFVFEHDEIIQIAQFTGSLERLVLDVSGDEGEINVESAGECFLQYNKQTLRKERSRIRMLPNRNRGEFEMPQWGGLIDTSSDSED